MTAIEADLSGFLGHEPAGEARLDLLVPGARCAGCMAKIERGLAALPGVRQARLNLTTHKLTVIFAGPSGDPARILETLDGLGYRASLFDPAEARAAQDLEGRRLALGLGVAGFGAGNVMMFSVPLWAGLFGQELEPATRTLMYWLSAMVATPCALYAGMTFFRSAWSLAANAAGPIWTCRSRSASC